MFPISKNKKMLTMIAIIVALVVILASITISWNKIYITNKSSSSYLGSSFTYFPFVILNATGDRVENSTGENITDSIKVLEITMQLNTKKWNKNAFYENLELNLSNVKISIRGELEIFHKINDTTEYWQNPGVWNNTTQTWDEEPSNKTILTKKIDYGMEINAKNAFLFGYRFYFAYSLKDKDKSFDNGDKIYDKEDKHIMNDDDIVKIIINLGSIDIGLKPKEIYFMRISSQIYDLKYLDKDNLEEWEWGNYRVYRPLHLHVPDFSNSTERFVNISISY